MAGAGEEHVEQIGLQTACISMALLLTSMAFVISRTARDALYIQERGLFDLPLAYIGMAILSAPMATLILIMMRYGGPRLTRIVAPLATGMLLIVYQRVAEPGGGPLMTFFFMLISLVFGVLFSVVWLFGAELLESASQTARTRAYSLMGAATITGGVLGSALARIWTTQITPEALLGLAFVLVVGAALVIVLTQRWFPASMSDSASSSDPRPRTRDIAVLIQRPYTCLLLGVAMLTSLVGVLVEFQFYLAAATSGRGSQAQIHFFANLYLVLNAVALLFQLVVMPRLQRHLGIAGSLLILPIALLGGVVTLVGSASLLTRSLLRVTEGGLKSSIHRANWEQAYIPIDRGTRAVAKVLIDGAGARLAEGLGAVILVVWLRYTVGDTSLVDHDTRWLTWLLLMSILVWLLLIHLLGRNLTLLTRSEETRHEMRAEIPIPDS